MIIEVQGDVLTLWGVLAKNSGEAVLPAVLRVLSRHPSGVVLDLAGVSQATPDGAAAVRDAGAHVARLRPGARLAITGAIPAVARVFAANHVLGGAVTAVAGVADATSLLPATVPADTAPLTPDANRKRVVLVALFGAATDEHAVAVACRLAESIASDPATGEPAAQMYLAHLFTVARDREIAPGVHGDAENAAQSRLRQLASAARTGGCVASVTTLMERTRDGATRLTDLAGDLGALFLVLAFGANATADEVELVRYVVEHAPCEVIVNRVPLSELREGDPAGVTQQEAKP